MHIPFSRLTTLTKWFVVASQVPLIVRVLKLRIEEYAQGRVGYPPLSPNFMIVFVFPPEISFMVVFQC